MALVTLRIKKIFERDGRVKSNYYSLSHWPGLMDDGGIGAHISLSALSLVSCPPGYFGTGVTTIV